MTKEVTLNQPCARNHLRHPLCDHLDFSGKCFYVAGVVALVVLGILTLGVGPLVIYGLYKAFSKKSAENHKSSEILLYVDPQQVKRTQPASSVPRSNTTNLTFVIEQPNISEDDKKTKVEKAIKNTKLSGYYFVWCFSSARVDEPETKEKFAAFCEKHKKDNQPIYFVTVIYADQKEFLQNLKELIKDCYLKNPISNCRPDPLILAIDPSNPNDYKAWEP